MGIYDSGLSCWERNQRGLAADHAGEGVIGENKDEEIANLISMIQSDVVTNEEQQPDSGKPKIKVNPKKKTGL